MNLEYKYLLPRSFSANSRVWVYQGNRMMSMGEALETEELLNQFTAEWQSHGEKVAAYGNLFFGQFVVLMADEAGATVGGCSTDASVRFIKELGNRFNIDFFDRTKLAFLRNEKIELLPMVQLNYAFENGFLNEDSLYFNTLVQTKAELEEKFIIPVKDSWINQRIKKTA